MTHNAAAKKSARALMERDGIGYTEAYRRVTAPVPAPTVPAYAARTTITLDRPDRDRLVADAAARGAAWRDYVRDIFEDGTFLPHPAEGTDLWEAGQMDFVLDAKAERYADGSLAARLSAEERAEIAFEERRHGVTIEVHAAHGPGGGATVVTARGALPNMLRFLGEYLSEARTTSLTEADVRDALAAA